MKNIFHTQKRNLTRLLAFFLVVIQLFSLTVPAAADDVLLEQRFNLDYIGSRGYQILELYYENVAVRSMFSDLADRSIALKTTYSTSEAIAILTETKSVVKKITKDDYKRYGDAFEADVDSGSAMMSARFTFDSFIMRNVLYAMLKSKASYNELMKAIQLIYDTGVIQTEKEAFRSDALDVLIDAKILASYTTENNIADMLYYVSKFSSGVHGNYTGDAPIKSVNVSNKYDEYLQDEYDKSHGGGDIEHNQNTEDSEYSPGGYVDGEEMVTPPTTIPGVDSDNQNGNGTILDEDNFSSDIDGILDGSGVGKYTLCYTTTKSSEKPSYQKTKITTKQYVTYDNIISVLTTADRKSVV